MLYYMKAFTTCPGYFLISTYDLESSEKKKPQIKKVFQLDLVVGKSGGHFFICN